MRIVSMTATFGKLEHQTIHFQPGLNVIHAPNEWGKSTWCAFLCAMLYGIDTRERTKQGVIADKERYKPWSGSPMSGRIELFWNGKDITIERSTGRTVFSEFRAYETKTGLPVPELTGSNCGQVLLGVEKSVFTRSAFIRQTDLPVGEDEALRRRLNALVTTGDETCAGDDLAAKLKNLKNRCRHNKTGLLPQAEAQRQALQERLAQLSRLSSQSEDLRQRQEALDREISLLENHKAALAYADAQADLTQVHMAWDSVELARQQLETRRAESITLPDRQETMDQLLNLEQLLLDREALDAVPVPLRPEMPTVPDAFSGLTPQEAVNRSHRDKTAYDTLSAPVIPLLLIGAGMLLLAGLTVGLLLRWLYAIPFPLVSVLLLAVHFRGRTGKAKKLQALTEQYPGLSPDVWVSTAKSYAQAAQAYENDIRQYESRCRELEARKNSFNDMVSQFTDGLSIHEQLNRLRDVLNRHDTLQRAEEAVAEAEKYAQTLAGMVKTVLPPVGDDPLDCDLRETEARLLQAQSSRRQLEIQQGQLKGQTEALGSAGQLNRQLASVEARIEKLEDIYSATVLAMETLSEASAMLQRKFAPRISRHAQSLFTRMTDGKYDQLLLDQDLSLHIAATGEDQLRQDLWRSDGTLDQLYLSLRLAVAAELTPESPLVLDDALVRFDDTRLCHAMEILKQLAEKQQVILFTCQKREENCL